MVSYFKFHCKAVILCYLFYVVCAVINHEQQFESSSEFFAGSETKLHRQKRGVLEIVLGAAFGAVLGAAATGAFDSIVSTFKGVESNQCKYSITHRGEFQNVVFDKGFDIECETRYGDINETNEILNGVLNKANTDTGHESISSSAGLKTIRFIVRGTPCVTAIAINCGDETYKSDDKEGTKGGMVFIDFEDLESAVRRSEAVAGIRYDAPKCVRFGGLVFTKKLLGLEIDANIFKCTGPDHRLCKQPYIHLTQNN